MALACEFIFSIMIGVKLNVPDASKKCVLYDDVVDGLATLLNSC